MTKQTAKRVLKKVLKYLVLAFILGIIQNILASTREPAMILFIGLLEYVKLSYGLSLIEQPKTHVAKKIIYYIFVVARYLTIITTILGLLGVIIE